VAKRPTVYDVAERAGVSIATVSFTFRRPDKVKVSTREVVQAAALALGYVPSANARGLARGRTGALGLYSFDYLVGTADADDIADRVAGAPDADATVVRGDPNENLRLFPLYVDEVQRGVELECRRRGYALMIGAGGDANGESVVADIAGRVDGLAVFPGTVSSDVLRHISRRIPVVELSEPSHDDRLNHVTVDNVAGMRALTEHLITEHGLRDLHFVGALDSSDNWARFTGFRSALRSAGLRVPRTPFACCGGDTRQAAIVVSDLLARGALPHGLVCVTDQEALAMMEALSGAGVELPEAVAVTGFDGIAAGRIVRPALTTVRQPMEAMGRAVVDILVGRLADPDEAPVSRQLPVHVLLRNSCGCGPR
jgi:LacI family transcriptional regulator